MVLILNSERFTANALSQQVRTCHPGAECIVVHRVDQARHILGQRDVSLFITGVGLPDGDVLDLLLHCSRAKISVGRTVVVSARAGSWLLVGLRRLGVAAVFDSAAEDAKALEMVLRRLEHGGSYWSARFIAAFMAESTRVIQHQLSATEQLAFAIMGTGCSDRVAADRMGLAISSARSLRSEIHVKVHAHDKEELMRTAAQYGFTRFTAEGLVPVGLAMLVLNYLELSKRPANLPASLLAVCGFRPRTPLMEEVSSREYIRVSP